MVWLPSSCRRTIFLGVLPGHETDILLSRTKHDGRANRLLAIRPRRTWQVAHFDVTGLLGQCHN
jgi:hypothetical protein